ncbi:MAG: hypothetical protein RL662_2142 [Bacteroidota bacterium]|jgi:HlyD family secretion protein
MSKEDNKSGSKLIPILVFAAVIIGAAFYGFFFLNQTDDILQGEVEITEVRISSKIPGRIEKFCFQEGDTVRKGDTLAILSAPDVRAKLSQATAVQEGAAAQNEKAIKGARIEQINAAYEMWQKAKVGVDIAQKSYTRVQNLFDKGVTTAQKRDEAEANYQAALATERGAKSQYDMAKNGAENEDKKAAQAMLNRAKGAVDEVGSYINEMYLISPLDGRISNRFPNVGELVGTGAPVMNVMDLSDKWATFNVREDRMQSIKIASDLDVFIPALNKNVKIKVYYMKDLGSYAAWKATKTTGSYDRKTFEVRGRFIDDQPDVLPGMSIILKGKH